MESLKSVTLEMSLKPFKRMDKPYMEAVCRRMFGQWRPLLRHADTVKVLLWTSDGSEILEYKRDMDQEVEWAKYIGGANPRDRWDRQNDPEGVGLHTRSYLYMDNPPVLTYGILRDMVSLIKQIGAEETKRPIEVGTTFDPGPEFAKSSFKYERHNEICIGDTMGAASFVCCYGVLHEDPAGYAGYPDGIPEGTPFGTFFGKQCRPFLADMGFDYLWLSNGFGFGTETWGTTGAIYDGESFQPERMADTQRRILAFWKLFRAECPDVRVETRGTNLSAGIDLSTDAVPLRDIYEGGFDILPPPNSPWAAINGDFGLELTGYMSRIAELPPGDDFLFRFYTHDPWWMNSPWLDRYEGQPHDIYLPLAVSRINQDGQIASPGHLNLLTVDNCLGEMPDQVPSEVIPHLLKAYERRPDAPAPLVWVYPFREYHDDAVSADPAVERPFFEDWFIRGAINRGLPLGTVVSSDNFVVTAGRDPALYGGSIVISPVPDGGSEWEATLLDWMAAGNKAILYGSVRKAGERMLGALNLRTASPLEGELEFDVRVAADEVRQGEWPKRILHRAAMSDGGIDTVLGDSADRFTQVAATAGRQGEGRVAALIRRPPEWREGAVAWVRGANTNRYERGEHLLVPDDAEQYFPAESLLRLLLAEFGVSIRFDQETPRSQSPVVLAHRSNGALVFSGYTPDTTVGLKLRYPLGAPLLLGWETRLEDGYSVYRLPRAWQAECRVFVRQEARTLLSCKEYPSVSFDQRRRIQVTGLDHAEVVVLPETGLAERTQVLLNAHHPYEVGEELDRRIVDTPWGRAIALRGVTGSLMISTPRQR